MHFTVIPAVVVALAIPIVAASYYPSGVPIMGTRTIGALRVCPFGVTLYDRQPRVRSWRLLTECRANNRHLFSISELYGVALDACGCGFFPEPWGLLRKAANSGSNWPPKPRKCGPNEIWKECVSPECAEQTCPPKNVDACTSLCSFDCYCADGFARDRRGICISVQDCLNGGPRHPQFRPFGHNARGQSSWPLNPGSRFRHPPRPPSYPDPHIVYQAWSPRS
ncbi:uncharacterized protein LOC144138978 [Haemaphysalis longicornis]